MPNYTLNPTYITGSRQAMPQIYANNGVGIDTTPLPTEHTTPLAFQATGAANPFPLSSLIGGVASIGTSLINNLFENGRAREQREWNEKQADKQWERDLEMWNMTNEYNTPANQVQRMKDAGLNPMSYGLDGSSAQAMQAPQTLGYERSTMPAMENPFPAIMDARVKEAQIANIEAETEKTKSETDQNALENEFLEKTLDIRIKAEYQNYDIGEERKKEIRAHTGEMLENINKIAAETKTEGVKQMLMSIEAMLKQGEYTRLMTLLPLEVNLFKAKTETERVQGACFAMQFLIEKDKRNGGYYDAIIDRAKAEAKTAEERAKVEEITRRIKEGTPNELAQWFKDNPDWKAAHPALAFLTGDMFELANALEESGLTKLLGISIGGSMLAGKKMSTPAPGQPGGKPKYATMYGPDGKPIMYN